MFESWAEALARLEAQVQDVSRDGDDGDSHHQARLQEGGQRLRAPHAQQRLEGLVHLLRQLRREWAGSAAVTARACSCPRRSVAHTRRAASVSSGGQPCSSSWPAAAQSGETRLAFRRVPSQPPPSKESSRAARSASDSLAAQLPASSALGAQESPWGEEVARSAAQARAQSKSRASSCCRRPPPVIRPRNGGWEAAACCSGAHSAGAALFPLSLLCRRGASTVACGMGTQHAAKQVQTSPILI